MIAWFDLQYRGYSQLLQGNIAGVNLTATQGLRAKKAGYRKGTPDLDLKVACEASHGLLIELKTETGVVSAEQKDMHQVLREQGYTVLVCRGFDECRKAIDDYMRQHLAQSNSGQTI